MYFLRDSDGIFRISGRFFLVCWLHPSLCANGKLSALIPTFRTTDVFLNYSDTDMFDCSIVVIFSRRLVVS